jgi:hypothetical protein
MEDITIDNKIKVYIKIDENNIIKDINSSIFLNNVEGYIQVDEGQGDKYAHAQGNYLDKGLIDSKGKYNYKLVDGKVVELTTEEKATLFPPVAPQPTEQELLNAQLLMSNADIKQQSDAQQTLNSELLLEIANLKGGIN